MGYYSRFYLMNHVSEETKKEVNKIFEDDECPYDLNILQLFNDENGVIPERKWYTHKDDVIEFVEENQEFGVLLLGRSTEEDCKSIICFHPSGLVEEVIVKDDALESFSYG